MIPTRLFREFFNSEKSGGLILIVCAVISLVVSNLDFGESYRHFWQIDIAGYSLAHWINDGLMTIFFLLIGLELEREIYEGELSNAKDALLPAFAAIGGMLVPAVIYMVFNFGTATMSGAGIPMATDIAFALGILSLLGKRVPTSLKVFLTALAVIDDLGAILVIAIFYSKGLVLNNLMLALGIFIVLLIFNRLKIRNLFVYLIGGIAMWFFMHHSGIHATITGVLLAFAIPFEKGNPSSASNVLMHFLHKPVAFFILPLFALANTTITLNSSIHDVFAANYSLGVALGLIIGKPLGIVLFTLIVIKTGLSKLPSDLNLKSVTGVGFLGGIGFTMSVFITLLAFEDEAIMNDVKLVILVSSAIAGLVGYSLLKMCLKDKNCE